MRSINCTADIRRVFSSRAGVLAAALVGLSALHLFPAQANDSSASLDADGLRLTYNPSIVVESEDLISASTRSVSPIASTTRAIATSTRSSPSRFR